MKTTALTRRFGKFTAVDSISLAVNAGEAFALLGFNGAGRTTTIKMPTTLLPPSSGEALVTGLSITSKAFAVTILRAHLPHLKIRVGNVVDLRGLQSPPEHPTDWPTAYSTISLPGTNR